MLLLVSNILTWHISATTLSLSSRPTYIVRFPFSAPSVYGAIATHMGTLLGTPVSSICHWSQRAP
eukprot:5170319-Pyramimonas_sp.AAC.4